MSQSQSPVIQDIKKMLKIVIVREATEHEKLNQQLIVPFYTLLQILTLNKKILNIIKTFMFSW